jgi:Uma2 family endonuclease
MALARQKSTWDDLRRLEALPENRDKLFELINGEIIEKMAASFKPSQIAATLIMKFASFPQIIESGYITGADGGYIMDGEGTKFIPDVAYISKERLPRTPQRESPVPPDLAVEVISPTDNIKHVQMKARRYLEYGTKLVWIIYPDDEWVDVCALSDDGSLNIRTLTTEDTLTGGDVLPDFEVKVIEIFPK